MINRGRINQEICSILYFNKIKRILDFMNLKKRFPPEKYIATLMNNWSLEDFPWANNSYKFIRNSSLNSTKSFSKIQINMKIRKKKRMMVLKSSIEKGHSISFFGGSYLLL
jgi:hypothetical protein